MCRRCANLAISIVLIALAACSSTPGTPSGEPAKMKAAPIATSTAAAIDVSAAPPPIPPEATQRFERALTLLGSGDLTQAEAEFKRLNASYPDYSGPLANLGVIYLKNGKLADAEKALRAATERGPQNAAAFNQLGIVYRNLGRFKEADAAYSHAIEVDANYALAHLNLGVLCDLYLQKPERALASFERYLALSANPDAKVTSWVKELRSRLGVKQPAANTAPSADVARSEP